jgi:hypothetical protein
LLCRRYNWVSLFPENTLQNAALRFDRPGVGPFAAIAATSADPTPRGRPQNSADELPVTARDFQKQRVQLAQSLYTRYNHIVFDNLLPADTDITWNKRMLKKAGQAVLVTNRLAGTKMARIELSEKVKIYIEHINCVLRYSRFLLICNCFFLDAHRYRQTHQYAPARDVSCGDVAA